MLTCACALAVAQSSTSSPNSASTNIKAATGTKKPAAKNSTAGKVPSKRTHSVATKSGKSTARTGKSTHASSRNGKNKKKTARGQQKIDTERAQAIQEALVREHYLSNSAASGTWNESSEAAMRRYQADHGWQSKTVPDSRALISLGLGPSQDHLLNPESAMTTGPAPRAASLTPASHSAEPGPVAGSEPDASRPQ